MSAVKREQFTMSCWKTTHQKVTIDSTYLRLNSTYLGFPLHFLWMMLGNVREVKSLPK